MAVVEEDLCRQAVHESAGATSAGDDTCVWKTTQQLQHVPGCGLGRLPGAPAAKDVLQLSHAGHCSSKAIELALQAGVLAPDLLMKVDDHHVLLGALRQILPNYSRNHIARPHGGPRRLALVWKMVKVGALESAIWTFCTPDPCKLPGRNLLR